MENDFIKYRKKNTQTKILFMYLLLNKYDKKKVVKLEEVEEDRMFGLKIKKVYGITEEVVDVRKINEEIENIQNPIICSPQSYEYYSDSAVIYTYKPKIEGAPFCINDMGIISKIMVIKDDYIISSNIAKTKTDTDRLGFMYFFEYVTKSSTTIDKWTMTYDKNVFNIFYKSTNKNKESGKTEETNELLYSAIEIDKTSTYKIVIYIIDKVARDLPAENWENDNFECETYELAVKNG